MENIRTKNRNTVSCIVLILMMAVFSVPVMAQNHGNTLNVSVGGSYPNGLEGTFAYEHAVNYHSAWEYFASYYFKYDKDPDFGHVTRKSFWNNYNTWNVGVAYKPCVSRGRNHHGNFRIGASAGSDLDHAIGIFTVGYEHTFILYHGWAFFFQVKEDVGIRLRDTFRTGAYIGVKVPM